jgi:TM2 domain-containing membrane protein YozV
MADSNALNLGTEGQILYDANKKSKLVSYLLWLFLGGFGAHRFYNCRVKSGLAMLATAIGAGVLYFLAMKPMFDYIAANPQAASNPEDPAVQQAMGEIGAQMITSPLFYAAMALLLIYVIWWIVDAFLIPGWVRRHNEELVASLRGR